jgi:hypothetical protein
MTDLKKSKARKWTKEAVIADAQQFTSKSEWRKASHAYSIAHRNGWIDEACAHMTALWTAKWDKKAVLLDALNYQARGEWETKNSGAVASAKRNGWYEEATQHMPMLIEKWTKESVIADAQKYQTRGEWFAKSKSYSIARNNNWVNEATAHMFTTLSFGELVIYTFLLQHDISFTHQKTFENLRNINKLPFDFYLEDLNLLIEYNGIQHERGWQGNSEDARNIKKRDKIKFDFAVRNNIHYCAINATDRQHIVKEVQLAIQSLYSKFRFASRELTNEETHLLRSLGTYTKEEVALSASKYSTIRDWRANAEAAYNKALKMKWLDEVTTHMTRLIKVSGHWTNEAVHQSAIEFKTQTAWKKAHGGAWRKAVQMGWIQEVCAHMDFMDESKIKPQGYWTKDRVLESAKKYKTQAEWNKAETSAVAVANKKGWIKEATAHMSPSRPNRMANGYWTKERVMEDAKKFNSKTEWQKASKAAVSKAYRMGWMDAALAHMQKI